MSFLYIILVLVAAGLFWWAAQRILNAPGMVIAEPFKTIIYVVIVVALILFVIQALIGPVPGWPTLHR